MHSVAAKSLFVVLFSLFLFELSSSQDPPVKWGDIPREDLEMQSCPSDPNASVLVLCDYGESAFDNELNIVFKKHLRVKVLTQKGFDWGTFSIVLANGDVKERIKDIEGTTYSLDEKGAVIRNDLTDGDIFRQDIDDRHNLCRFTLPALKRGCVFEVRYTIIANSLFYMRDWDFQSSEPVRWSEYRIRSPRNISYAAITWGFEPYSVKEIRDVNQFFSGSAATLLDGSLVRCYEMRWVAQNLPALRDEPYITTLDDYTNKINVQLAAYTFHGSLTTPVLHTWDVVLKELLDSGKFGGRIDDTHAVRKRTEEVTRGLTTPEEKMRALYKWVATSIVWDGKYRLFADQDVNDVLDSRKGNNAEITFLLLSMLKSAGIEGAPVIVSTRSNGVVQDIYPMVNQFNYVLAKATVGTQTYFLDARDPFRPFELLPPEVLNVRGLVVKNGDAEWVTVTSGRSEVLHSYASVRVRADGWVTATLQDTMTDYGAYFARRDLGDRKTSDVLKEAYETEATGLALDSAEITGKDSVGAPLVYEAWVSSPMYAQGNGDFIYLNPHIIHRTRSNVFKREVRKFPVDFSYTRDFEGTVVIAIPDSFELREPVGNRSFTVGPDLVTYSRLVRADQKTIEVKTEFRVRQTTVMPKYYATLKAMYGKIVTAEDEQFVLARIKKPAPPVQVKPERPVPPQRKKSR